MATTAPHPSTGDRRDFKAMERVRLRAARMFEQGTSQAEVAHRLGTSRQNAHRWHRQWQQGGRAALRAAGRAGRRPKLDTRARLKVERALGQGALAHGFDSDLWTLKRVAVVIERLTGVHHHPSHSWRILRAMGWSVQRPQRRANERDEEAIARWVTQDWPRIRQKRVSARRLIVFWDESGVSFTPPVRRTWAPRGHTPILRHRWRRWAKLSMAAMCCYRPDGARARLAFHLQPGSDNDQLLIGVLGQLRRFLGGQKVTLLWDGLPCHRRRPMQAFVRSQRGWLVVERLPGYAPELNPVEGVWSNLKGQEFANYAADTINDLTWQARRGITRLRRRPRLLFAFLDRTGLSLSIYHGLYGFNAVLCAIALGGLFYVLTWKSAIYALLAAVFSVVAFAGIAVLLAPIGMPALTAPFVLTTWLFLWPKAGFGALEPVPMADVTTPENIRATYRARAKGPSATSEPGEAT